MPAPVQDVLTETKKEIASFSIEPALNAAHSLFLLTMTEDRSGLGDWVVRTDEAMDAALRQRNRLVMVGFYYLVNPRKHWSSFPAFVDDLAGQDPASMRDDLMQNYAMLGNGKSGAAGGEVSVEQALTSADNYVAFLRERFDDKAVDEELEREAYTYVAQPEALQELIVSHLLEMWTTYLEAEWERVRPMLKDSVAAFRQVELSGLSKLEAMEFVTGEGIENDHWAKMIENHIEQVVFVPSVHVGPYVGRFHSDKTLWVLFGARLPDGVDVDAPDLSRADIVVRLNALADDDRLRILKLVAERGELRSAEVMEALDFSQSATSRHLKQLTAAGFLTERRCAGAKCYQLNPVRIERTMDAIANFLAPVQTEAASQAQEKGER
ncbi:MAG: ArsR family transcriptional regulator [Chloroflexi bacterium]|nr:ArsR family transcriptional regulator [Chloroflexota bacterium]